MVWILYLSKLLVLAGLVNLSMAHIGRRWDPVLQRCESIAGMGRRAWVVDGELEAVDGWMDLTSTQGITQQLHCILYRRSQHPRCPKLPPPGYLTIPR